MGELAHPVKIRSHHLLCLLGFRGLGYSPEFVETMGKVFKEFHSDTTLPITVVTGCDIICNSCPHNRDNKCRKKEGSARRVKNKDVMILKKLGFPENTETTSGEVRRRVKERITAGDLTTMCQRCGWLDLGYCHEGLAELAAGSVSLH